MYRVLNCLETQHDPWLVFLAGLVCLLTSFAAVNIFHRAAGVEAKARLVWLATTGTVTGFGVWSTHFIAMLAYTPGLPIEYDMSTTVISLAVAIVLTTAGFAAALSHGSRRGTLAGGAIIGAGIASMHYLGMAALEVPADIVWIPDLIIASILLGVVFSAASLVVAKNFDTVLPSIVAAVLLALAIVVHHFVAMGAFGLVAKPALSQGGAFLPPAALSLAIAAVTITVVVGGLIGAISDRRSSVKISLRNDQLDAALSNMGQGLCMFGADNRLQLWNERFLAMYGIPSGSIAPGLNVEQLLEISKAAGGLFKDPDQYLFEVQSAIERRVAVSRISKLVDGRTIAISYCPIQNGGWVATHEDVTERKQSEDRIAHLALHDPVTDLPNRAALRQCLARTVSKASVCGMSFAIARVDIDRLKEINEAFGQSSGDVVLTRLGERLKAICGTDFLARQGGDEFTLISDVGARGNAVEDLCVRLSALLSSEFDIDGERIRVGCTIGISSYPQDGTDPETLIAHADAALYRAKEDERGTIRLFEPTIDRQLREKRLLRRDLVAALENEEFELYFQPQAMCDGNIIGFEALVRWKNAKRGIVSPGVFIPAAEEAGLVGLIDEWVLREACREAASWTKPLSIAVNLSPIGFRRGDISSTILSVLTETGLDPKRLEVEVTESVLIDDFERAVSLLCKIKEFGVRVALDDFGTGYSSLSYLQSFPFDKIKIDQSFVRRIGSNDKSTAIVQVIVGLGRALGVPVIAEGVETQDQLAFLAREKCAEIQGYLIGRPQPIAYYNYMVEAPIAIAS